MPNRDTRRHGADKALDKWLYVEDGDGNPYEIFLRDISGKDEYEFLQMMQGTGGGLCDIFLEGKVTLVNIAGLIWTARRKFEKKLTILDVLRTVNMACIETLELHDPDDEDDEEEAPAVRMPADPSEGLPGFGEPTGISGPSSEPSTG